MKAVGYKQPLPITNPDSLLDIEIPEPVPAARDLLVEIRAVSINPVDAKVRARSAPEPGEYKILGFDGAGVVKAIGPEVTMFHPGDEVWYSGTILRPGTNMELHLVDERIVGPKPKSLDFSQAAAMPLTTMTAWELLFDRLGVRIGKDIHAGSILIVGGSGGVGSILTQLARRLTGLTIVSTASSPESVQRCLELGAHFAIDYRKPFGPQMQAIGLPEVEYIACLVGSDVYYPGVIDVLAPQGKIGMIDDPPTLDAIPLKRKSASLHWEFMFARALFQTPDMIAQHNELTEVARMVDEGIIRTTLGTDLGTINAKNLRKAHELIESGHAKGKIVLTGF